MEKAKKILYIVQELEPFLSSGEMPTLMRQVIPAVQETGREVRTFMPKWCNINERRNQLHEVIRLSGVNLIIDGSDHQLIIKVATINQTKVQVYFIDNDDYMRGHMPTRDKDGKLYKDNIERAMFFARGTLETVKKLRWVPEIIHCVGWISALSPYLIKMAYYDEPCFRETSIIFTPDDENLNLPMPKNLKGILAYREATTEAIAPLGKFEVQNDINRIGMYMCDAVLLRKPNPEYERMAKFMGKPLAIMDPEAPAQTTTELYDRLWKEILAKRPKKDDDDGFLF